MQPMAVVRQLDLRTGPAILIEMGKPYQGTFGVWRLSLLWSTADRVYALTGALSAPVKSTFADVARAWTRLAAIAEYHRLNVFSDMIHPYNDSIRTVWADRYLPV